MSEPYIAIQTVMLPKDTNPHGTIFGGVLLANTYMAGAIGAQREVQRQARVQQARLWLVPTGSNPT